ncbi:MAG: glutamyl-tRNA reductase [Deltaproteobacteria bacterium]|nr:glutamyl-tRNA reductase [Deltaproteobacteria bacterium]
MIRIVNIGMNHETAPVELRECLAKDPAHADRALAMMRELSCVKEGIFLSTCNRVEALFTTEQTEEAKNSIVDLLSGLGGMPSESLCSSLFTYEDRDAVRHIFRVASSLDSMVIGEPQILGQIKEAYASATKEKTTGVILNRLLHRAFHTAKRVRTETGIADAAVSVSYAAVELAKKIFYEFKGKKVLLIGAGEMAELAARHLLTQGVSAITVANRTFQKAVEVAQGFKGVPVSFEEIGTQLLEADIVISSTAAPGSVITHDQVKGSMKKRKNRPLFFIDIAVPRDVEPEVNDLENVYVYDIDDLKGIIQVNLSQREGEAVKAERIVEEEVIKFEQWLKTLEVVPTIVSLKEKAETIRQAELKKSLSGLGELSPLQIKSLETLTLSITEKILNDPILFLKQKADRPLGKNYLDTARRLFRLDRENGDEVEHGSEQDDRTSEEKH